jgi:hypothetical protein
MFNVNVFAVARETLALRTGLGCELLATKDCGTFEDVEIFSYWLRL